LSVPAGELSRGRLNAGRNDARVVLCKRCACIGKTSVRHDLMGRCGLLLLAFLALAAAVLGCGSSHAARGSSTSTSVVPPDHRSPDPSRALADPSVAEIGRRACSDMSPREAAARFASAARRAGVRASFIAMAVHPPASVQRSAGYPRLVAALYASTLPEAEQAQAAAECARELAAGSHGDGALSIRAGR
jgi:hypothetical protein